MKILLSPNNANPQELRDVYDQAFREATELYIASAFLTDWNSSQKLGKECKRVVFLVGTDFGLSRKLAMLSVLRWIPKGSSFLFRAVSRGFCFHPKVIAWKAASGRYYCVVGSSNLSKAAFANNYEANVFTELSEQEIGRIVEWLNLVARPPAVPITEDWIHHHYKEASLPKGGWTKKSIAPVKLKLPQGPEYAGAVRKRRGQQAAFPQIGADILSDARTCADGKMTNTQFWERFWNLWSNHKSRFQGKGLEISGKAANWRQACRTLTNIFDAAETLSQLELDHTVSEEIDELEKAGNPARGAWLSEMLCHYLPARYPVHNSPVRKWLAANRYRGRRGATPGQRYVELAQQLRDAVQSCPAGARNLAELDASIWLWVHKRGL